MLDFVRVHAEGVVNVVIVLLSQIFIVRVLVTIDVLCDFIVNGAAIFCWSVSV